MTDSDGKTFIVHYNKGSSSDTDTVVIEQEDHIKVVHSKLPELPVKNPHLSSQDKKMIDMFFKGELCLKGVNHYLL
jgi:hypothetical protein